MSINVTVTNHPISVKRGRVINTDHYSNGDFQKRRRIRLEQVRQQSKDIAEKVRNRVKKATSSEQGDIEKEGKLKLQEWQNKKLQGLQNQYRQCIKDIGLGHTQAVIEDAEERAELENQERINTEKAIERGNIAAEKLKKPIPEPKRKIPIVISPKKQRVNVKDGSKKPIVQNVLDINIDFNAENVDKNLTVEEDNQPISELSFGSSSNKSPRMSPNKQPPLKTPLNSASPLKALKSLKEFDVFGSNFTSNQGTEVTLGGKKCEENSAEIMDTRISERIKNRRLNNIEVEVTCNREILSDRCKSCNRHNEEKFVSRHLIQDTHKCCCCKFCDVTPAEVFCKCKCNQIAEVTTGTGILHGLPTKRSVSLKTTDTLKSCKRDFNKVPYYDHNNRFHKEILTDNCNMRKISNDSIEVCLNSDESETAFNEINIRHDKEALDRGKKAIRKEMLEKQFKNLMEKLPVLQRQERIASLNPKKDKYHLSQSRLKEKEKKEQEKLESAFEQLVPNVITIEENKTKNPKIFWKDCDDKNVSDDNLSSDQICLCDNTEDGSLKKLLSKLKKQKELLIKEKETLPSTSNILRLIDNLETDIENIGHKKTKTPKKKLVKKSDESIIKTPSKSSRKISSSSSSDSLRKSASKVRKPSTPCSPLQKQKNKHKLRRDVLILQNMSTQTSPNVAVKSNDNKSSTSIRSDKSVEPEKLCEILIKIQENEAPNIVVKSPQKLPLNETKESNNWKEQLSKNDTNYTSSTTYYSPPDFTREQNIVQLLNKKPQQMNMNYYKNGVKNIKSGAKNVDPRLTTLVRKLLQMSKGSIENLQVSGVSEVSTPNTSVINVATNYQAEQITTKSNDELDNRYKETTLNSNNSTVTQTITEANLRTLINKINSQTQNSNNSKPKEDDLSSIQKNGNQSVRFQANQSQQTSFYDLEINYPEVAQQYSKIATNCQERIKNLSELIQRVRTEQKEMLSSTNSSGSEKNVSITQYYNLPLNVTPEVLHDEKLQQKELTQKLLQINLHETKHHSPPKNVSNDELDPEIISRYLKLLNNSINSNDFDSNPPLMLDIPKLPKLQQTNDNNRKRPPTAKIIKKLDIQPHELSTIQEADSIRHQSKSPESKKTSPYKQITEIKLQTETKKSTEIDFTKLIDKLLGEQKKPLEKSPKQSVSTDTSSENLDVAAMLKTIGLDWAVTTARKTQEALAQHSTSSSSGKLSSSPQAPRKQRNISTSTSKSDTNISPYLRDFNNISSICVNETLNNHHRTSTPVNESAKKTNQPLFTGESDMSPVDEKQASDHQFVSLLNNSPNDSSDDD